MPAKNTPTPIDMSKPGEFSLADLLAGNTAPVQTVTVTTDADTAAEIERVNEQIERITKVLDLRQATGEGQKDGPRRRRLAEKDELRAELQDLQGQRDGLLAKLDGTYLDITVRRLTPRELDEMRKEKNAPGYDTSIAHFIRGNTTVRPHGTDPDAGIELDADGWDQLLSAIGETQFRMLDQAAGRLSYQTVMPDFYERYSASRPESPKNSSEN